MSRSTSPIAAAIAPVVTKAGTGAPPANAKIQRAAGQPPPSISTTTTDSLHRAGKSLGDWRPADPPVCRGMRMSRNANNDTSMVAINPVNTDMMIKSNVAQCPGVMAAERIQTLQRLLRSERVAEQGADGSAGHPCEGDRQFIDEQEVQQIVEEGYSSKRRRKPSTRPGLRSSQGKTAMAGPRSLRGRGAKADIFRN